MVNRALLFVALLLSSMNLLCKSGTWVGEIQIESDYMHSGVTFPAGSILRFSAIIDSEYFYFERFKDQLPLRLKARQDFSFPSMNVRLDAVKPSKAFSYYGVGIYSDDFIRLEKHGPVKAKLAKTQKIGEFWLKGSTKVSVTCANMPCNLDNMLISGQLDQALQLNDNRIAAGTVVTIFEKKLKSINLANTISFNGMELEKKIEFDSQQNMVKSFLSKPQVIDNLNCSNSNYQAGKLEFLSSGKIGPVFDNTTGFPTLLLNGNDAIIKKHAEYAPSVVKHLSQKQDFQLLEYRLDYQSNIIFHRNGKLAFCLLSKPIKRGKFNIDRFAVLHPNGKLRATYLAKSHRDKRFGNIRKGSFVVFDKLGNIIGFYGP